jgi:diguanylate cyclase (GGDEF)-like protein/PAS domain S-box-containing protein
VAIGLIETLHNSGRRLEDLTAGQVDAVTNRDGRTFLLRRAQDQLRQNEAAKQTAILNSLPAHIALLDIHGCIVSANAAWGRFPCTGVPHGAGHGVGLNYLEICDKTRGEHAIDACRIAEGIRSVLGGGVDSFSLEYSCGSPAERYWFQLTVTPLGNDPPDGVVVMQLDTTERRRAEEELSRFGAAMDSTADAIYLVNRSTMCFVHVNAAACRMQGRTREELLALGPAKMLSLPRAELERTYDAIIASGVAAEPLEIQRSRNDGPQVWVEIRRHAQPSGDSWMIVTLVRDITERKLAEGAILREKNFIAAMLDSLPGLFYLLDDQGRFLRWNRNFEVVSGYSSAEVSDLAPLHFFGKADKENVGRKIAKAFASGHATVEADFVAKDQSKTPYFFTGKRVQIEHKACLIGMGIDISARKRAEHDLHASELQFRQMAENIHDIFYLVDARSNRILYVSPAYETISGHTCESLLASPESWTASIHPDDRVTAEANIRKSAPSGHFDIEYRMVRPDGSIRWIESRGFPVNDATGEMVRVAGVAKDITVQKRDEIRIKRLNRVYAVLSGINTLIVRVTDHATLYREACNIALAAGEFGFVCIAIPNRVTQIFDVVAWAGDASFASLVRPSGGGTRSGGAGLAATAIATAKHVLCNDIAKEGDMLLHPDEALALGYHSAIALPLIVDSESIGALVLYAGEPDFFDEPEIVLLNELAGDIAFAIGNISRRQKLARLARTRAVSSEINSAIVRIHDRDTLTSEACRIAVDRGGYRMALIGVADWSAMKIVPIASVGVDPEFLTLVKERFLLSKDASLGNTMSVRAMREKRAIVSNDIRDDAKVMFAKERVSRGILSMAILPLIVSGEAVGVFNLYAGEAGFFDDEELILLTEMAGNVAFAMDHIDKQARLDYLGYYDELTGLANRKLFLDRVAQYMRSAVSGGHRLALILIDLERFKNINDSLGRPGGDAILRQVAELIAQEEGDANLVARVGADHFAVVMPRVKEESEVARHIQKSGAAFRDHEFRLDDGLFRLAARVGVAMFPDDGSDADTLFKHAEAALKKAKASGERFLFYTQTMTDKAAGTLTLENELRRALDKEEFVLYYQPKVSLGSGKVTGAEALIRWNDPRTGLVPPGHFIPVLEETGLIYDVGRWALRKAIEDFLLWRKAGLAPVRIAVNVSPLQLRNRGFIDEIRQLIGVDTNAAAGLELEITESVIMEDVNHNIASLQAIREMGIGIAIDDFGTGFSSLSYLAKLPVDTLKVDRSFVVGMTDGPQGLALVSTIINLAHSLELKVVAEGVETEEQSRLLRLLRCEEMQGFLFSKPVPADVFEADFLAAVSAA